MAVQEETGPVQVAVYCDDCGVTVTNDYLVPANEDSLVVARNYLATHQGWKVTLWEDLCPDCIIPEEAKYTPPTSF